MALTKISRGLLDTGVSDSSDATAITIDSSENVLLGVTSLNRLGSGSSAVSFSLGNTGTSATDSAEAYLYNAATASGRVVGAVCFGTSGASASEKRSALISSRLSATSSTNVSGELNFYTTNAGSIDERMRILADGTIGVGTGSPSNQFTIYRSGTEATASIHSNGQSELRFVANNGANTWIQAGTGPSSSQVPIYLTGMYGTSNTVTIDTVNGRCGIGTTSPSGKLHVAGDVVISASGTDANRYNVYYNSSTGQLIFVSSDERLKKDFDYDIEGIEIVKKLKPLRYSWKDSDKRQLGFLAQESIEADEHLAWNDTENDQWGLDGWDGYTAVLTKAIQEQQTIIDDLKTRIETLENA